MNVNRKLIVYDIEVSLYVAIHIVYGYMLVILAINPFFKDDALHEAIHEQVFQSFITILIIGWIENIVGGLT